MMTLEQGQLPHQVGQYVPRDQLQTTCGTEAGERSGQGRITDQRSRDSLGRLVERPKAHAA